VLLVCRVGADAVVRLAILRIALAPHGKAQASEREQIALMRCFDEHSRPHLGPVFKAQRRDARSGLRHAVRFLQPMPAQHGDARFLDPRLPNSLSHMRLESPQRRVLRFATSIASNASERPY
jgi:hypothetical protein